MAGNYSGNYGNYGGNYGNYGNLTDQQIQQILTMPDAQFNSWVQGQNTFGGQYGGGGVNTPTIGGSTIDQSIYGSGGPTNGIGGWTTDLANSSDLYNANTGAVYNPSTNQYTGGYGASTNTSGGLLNAISNLFGSGTTGAGSAANGSGLNLGGLANTALQTAPGLLALNYASNQKPFDTSNLQQALQSAQGLSTSGITQAGAQQISPQYLQQQYGQTTDPAQLQSIYNQLGANNPAYLQSVLDPMQQNLAAGYGDLQQSLAQRGISGSSFANNDLTNYLSTTGRSLSDAAASAYQGSLGQQAGVAGNIAGLSQADMTRNAGLAGQLTGVQGQNIANNLSAQQAAAQQAGANAGLQGNLAAQLANMNALAQQNQNGLYGRAFTLLGQGLSPNSSATSSLTSLLNSLGTGG